MPYMILMTDRPDQGALRAKTRAAHLDYLEANSGLLLAAGALIEDDGVGGAVAVCTLLIRRIAVQPSAFWPATRFSRLAFSDP